MGCGILRVKPLIVSQHLTIFGGHWSGVNGDNVVNLSRDFTRLYD